jgi:hypothetical protein
MNIYLIEHFAIVLKTLRVLISIVKILLGEIVKSCPTVGQIVTFLLRCYCKLDGMTDTICLLFGLVRFVVVVVCRCPFFLELLHILLSLYSATIA